MKTKLLFTALLLLVISTFSFSQTSDVKIKVKWGSNAFDNKVEIYNTANDLVATICDDTQCYTGTNTGTPDSHGYGSKYDLGCVTDGNNYYVKLFDLSNDGWESSSIKVIVAGVEVINDNGTGATSAGQTIYFNVSGGNANCSIIPDMDQDGLADYLDYDDDGDGITDGVENMGEDRFECTLPPLEFENGVYDAAASTAAEGLVGAVYRFGNAIEGKDVLMEIMVLDNAAISNIDNDTIDNPTYLQTELTVTDPGTPGATFKFTIVDAGTTTPSTEIYRVNGITWDTDGSGSLRESVIYYNPAAYGTENPTSLEVTDLGGGDIQIDASGLQEGPGFSNLKVLRAYFQFIGNSFELRMQAIRTSNGSTTRQFGMSFTQCEFLDFNANSLIIITGEDFDSDGKYNHLDLDSDNDGIPDNIEAQPTVGYVTPSGTIDRKIGIDTVYGSGLMPIDTDLDNTPDVLDLDTDNDGLLDIEENGMANSIVSFSDGDDDGLDLLFEGSVTNDPLDVNDDIDTPSASILPDADGDVFTGGDVDYRDLFNTNPPASALLDFDGVDDYLATDTFISGMNDISIMAWYRADAANSGTTTIAGEDRGCKLYLRSGNRPTFGITTQGNTLEIAATGVVAMNEWHHIAGTWSSSTGLIKLYVDGVLVNTNDTGVTGVAIETTALTEDAFAIGRTSRGGGLEYFDGAIDEVRVFDTVLTDDQIQRMVYQEIEQDMGNVHGSVIDKDVIDIATDTKVLWSDLIAYYPMTDIVSSRTYDYSNNNRHMYLYNITSVQAQTAPMPYESGSDGSWTTEGTWIHGDVWDIENVTNNKDWSIVRINDDVFTSASHTNLGLIVEDGKTLRVNGDNEINNSWYLELNGTMDLTNDSQLVQGINSDLVTGSNGKVLRRQSGSSNLYWYTYMSSPVGATSATSLIDNNTTSNNPNNTGFVFNTLKEGNGSAVQFTNAYNEVGKISTRWMYTFLNGITYYDWAHFYGTTALNPGVGYIHKGTGNAGLDQEYLFEGKPNNGTILIAADDVDGDSGNESQADVTQTTTLIGNPYPSAIDAHKFINDNAGVIDGTLYLWHQWAGSSHILNEYEGGYAVINLMAKIRAYQFVGYSGANNGNQDGTLTPKQYIPVGQAFMTEVIADGDIEFNNSQRIFKREAVGESQYFRTEQGKGSVTKAKGDPMQIIKLEFTTSNDLTREIAIGFSDFTGEGFDYGYDGKMFAVNSEDMYTKWGKHKMVTQAFGSITPETAIPLVVNATGNYTYTIEATDFIDFDATQEVYLRDNYRNVYFDLRAGGGYAFKAKPDQKKRFEIVFKNESKPIKAEQALDSDTALIYFNTTSDKLYVKSLNQTTKRLTLTDMSGKTIHQFNDLSSHTLEDGLRITNISSGIYMVSLQTETNQILNKKIIID